MEARPDLGTVRPRGVQPVGCRLEGEPRLCKGVSNCDSRRLPPGGVNTLSAYRWQPDEQVREISTALFATSNQIGFLRTEVKRD